MDAADIADVDVVVFDGFDELDAIGPYEVFANAADAGADLDVDLVTLGRTKSATASHGITVEAHDTLTEDVDLLIVPGGGWNDRSVTGAWSEVQAGDLPEAVRTAHESGAVVASVCTGAMILAAAGVLDGTGATTHAAAVDDLREYGAEPADARVVDAGSVLTAGGVTAGLDLAFWILEAACEEGIAEAVATQMEYEPSRDVAELTPTRS